MSEPTPEAATCTCIVLDPEKSSPSLLIERLAGGVAGLDGIPSPRTLAAAVLEREAQAPTFIGHATALPHARLPGLTRLAIAFARPREPLRWTPQGDLVSLVFLAAVPAAHPRSYLEFMRTLGRTLRDEARMAALLAAPDETAVRVWLAAHLDLR